MGKRIFAVNIILRISKKEYNSTKCYIQYIKTLICKKLSTIYIIGTFVRVSLQEIYIVDFILFLHNMCFLYRDSFIIKYKKNGNNS